MSTLEAFLRLLLFALCAIAIIAPLALIIADRMPPADDPYDEEA
jgi:hypothetical protein